MAYEWDANENLLNNGERTYTYNHVNRLIGLSDQGSFYSYAYNGFGDRLQQTVDGTTTNYTLDINTGLTQVLSDESNRYLYGLGRIGELQGSEWQYHLPDALSSSRQLVEASAIVNRSQSYEPFGTVLTNAGLDLSSYGFTGEWMDSTGLIYLRSRYYSPLSGRFFVKDPYQGTPLQPATMNAYQYALNNPILNTDPTGSIVCLCGIDPETGFCHPCSDRYSFLPPIFAQILPETILSFLNPVATIIIGALLCMPLIGELIREAPSITDILPDIMPDISDSDLFQFSGKAAGAGEAARHLAMLVGSNVAGYPPHPGGQDPEGRDRKHNAEGLRNTLRNIERNMRNNESIQQFLDRQGWDSRQIDDFIRSLRDYTQYTLEVDVEFYNVSEELAKEIIELTRLIGAIP
jgi:RHS repeat-associated protein